MDYSSYLLTELNLEKNMNFQENTFDLKGNV